MTSRTTPLHLDLQKDRQLTITWQDGHRSVYAIGDLRGLCPCASCKQGRVEKPPAAERRGSLSLKVLAGNQDQPLSAKSAELVGGYALRIDWSDGHGSGIYSFEYLRSIDPASAASPPQGG